MKNIFYISILILSLFCFTYCERAEFHPLEEYEFETVTWRLYEVSTWSDTGGGTRTSFDGERTLQFWNGTVRSNGSFCDLDGAVGPVEELSYNPVFREIANDRCSAADEVTYYYYEFDNDAGELRIIFDYFLVGTIYEYRISED